MRRTTQWIRSYVSSCVIGGLVICGGGSSALGAPRDIKIKSVDIEHQVVQIQNTGADPVSLDGWRLCTQNSTVVFHYTSPTGFNGVTLNSNESLTVHYHNDADGSDPMAFNVADLGGLIAPFEIGAYSLAIYFPNAQGIVRFNDGNLMADFLQWSLDGLDNTTADERSDEAQAGGVWADQSAWINVNQFVLGIDLEAGTLPHQSSDYSTHCLADVAFDQQLNFFDISAFLALFAAMDPAVDFNHDGLFNFFDISIFVAAINGCP